MSKYDEYFALDIHHELNCTGVTENAVLPNEKNRERYKPRTLVDHTLELIDPTPNVHTLFVQFNARFFWNVLLPVQVKWSSRMTTCAGICSFKPKTRECIISLSTPLLKLRPRKDLVETLLHEMIHAYLFLKNDNKDRDGHGPIFCSHMKRINKEAGTNITIYHTFHNEVELYKTHWWRCNGSCQSKPPYFGTIRRSTNRAPGPNDYWFAEHQQNCGGQFIKIKEPEKSKAEGKSRSKSKKSVPAESKAMVGWLNTSGSQLTDSKTETSVKKTNGTSKSTVIKPNSANNVPGSSNKIGSQTGSKSAKGGFSGLKSRSGSSSTTVTVKKNNTSNSPGLQKLGNSTNKVHGWGTGGPGSSSGKPSSSSSSSTTNKNPTISFSGTLGGTGTGRSNLLDKFSSGASTSGKTELKNSDKRSNVASSAETVKCPVCNVQLPEFELNKHLDTCLGSFREPDEFKEPAPKRKREDKSPNGNTKRSTNDIFDEATCPVCNKRLKTKDLNDHLDVCLMLGDAKPTQTIVIDESTPTKSGIMDNITIDLISTDDSGASDNDSRNSSLVQLSDSPMKCLICDHVLDPKVPLNEHLEECIGTVFNDDSIESEVPDSKDENNDYPCPICMQLISESDMNQHLDECFSKCD